jgi:hypothetical protein
MKEGAVMKRALLAMAAFAVLSVYAAPVELWYDDFSTRYNIGGSDKYFPPASPGLGEISTNNVVYPWNTWYRRSNEQYSTMFSTNGATAGNGNDLSPPSGSLSGTGMRAGYWYHDQFSNFSEINTGVILSNDINYTISFRASLKHRIDPATNLVGSGSVQMSLGFWDTTVASNNWNWFNAGKNFTNLTSDAWVTNAVTLYGGRMNLKAAGHPLVLRVTKKSPKNDTDFESWLDWIKIEGVDPWAEYAADEGISSDRTADDDEDGVDNFTEWAVGGDPGDPNDTGLKGSALVQEIVNTNNVTNVVFTFIIPRQDEWYPNGINYNFEGNEDLAMGTAWTNVYPWEWQPVEQGGYSPEFDAVTNFFSGTNSPANVESNENYFIRLRVDHRSYNP